MGGDPTKRFINRRTNAKSIPGVSSHRVYHRYVGFLCCFAIEAWPVKPAWETTDLSSRRRGNKRLFIGRRVSRLDRGRSIESLPSYRLTNPIRASTFPANQIPRLWILYRAALYPRTHRRSREQMSPRRIPILLFHCTKDITIVRFIEGLIRYYISFGWN